jgi:hypothetical protein
MLDWSEYSVQIPRLMVEIEQLLNHREYKKAEVALDKLLDLSFELKRSVIKVQFTSGTGCIK